VYVCACDLLGAVLRTSPAPSRLCDQALQDRVGDVEARVEHPTHAILQGDFNTSPERDTYALVSRHHLGLQSSYGRDGKGTALLTAATG